MITSGQWVERRTTRGYLYRVWRLDQPMPKIQQSYLDCSIYLYASRAAAEAGENFGGSGCLVSIESNPIWDDTSRDKYGIPHRAAIYFPLHIYAVTNKHVARMGCPVVRLNTVDGNTHIMELDHNDWIPHPDGDDLAIAPLELPPNTNYVPISIERFVSEDYSGVGAGDDTFMVGRFTTHDGGQRNTPTLRFGNIAMLPFEKIKLARELNYHRQEAFLVETRSISGYSGSPVFIYKPVETNVSAPVNDPYSPSYSYDPVIRSSGESRVISGLVGHPSLLGIDCGHVRKYQKIVNGAGVPHPQGWQVDSNTGMAIVIPAWRLESFLNTPELIMQRQRKNRQYQEEKEAEETVAMDAEKQEPFSEESYLEALQRASRKTSEPESEKKDD